MIVTAVCLIIVIAWSAFMGIRLSNVNRYCHSDLFQISTVVEMLSGICLVLMVVIVFTTITSDVPDTNFNHQFTYNAILYASSVYIPITLLNSWVYDRQKKRHDDYIKSLPVQLPLNFD